MESVQKISPPPMDSNTFIEELADYISTSLGHTNDESTKSQPRFFQSSPQASADEKALSDGVQQREVSSSKPSPSSLINHNVVGPLLLQALDSFLLVVKLDGTIEFASDNITNYLNYSVDDLMGKNLFTLLHPSSLHPFQKCLDSLSNNLPCEFINNKNFSHEAKFRINSAEEFYDQLDDSNFMKTRLQFFEQKSRKRSIDYDVEPLSPESASENSYLVCIAQRIGDIFSLDKGVPSAFSLGQYQFTIKQDLQGRILNCDPRGLEAFLKAVLNTTSTRDLVGKNVLEFCNEQDLNRLRQHHTEVIKNGTNMSGVYRFQIMPGKYAFVQTKSKLFSNSSNNKPEFIMSTHSIVRMCDTVDELSGSAEKGLIQAIIGPNFSTQMNSNWMKAFKMKGEQGLTHEVSIDDTNNTVLPSIIAAYNNENDHKQQKSPRGQKRKHLSSNNSDKSLNKLLPSSTDNEFEYSNKYSKLSDDVEKIFNGNIDGLKLSQDLFSYYVMNNSKTSDSNSNSSLKSKKDIQQELQALIKESSNMDIENLRLAKVDRNVSDRRSADLTNVQHPLLSDRAPSNKAPLPPILSPKNPILQSTGASNENLRILLLNDDDNDGMSLPVSSSLSNFKSSNIPASLRVLDDIPSFFLNQSPPQEPQSTTKLGEPQFSPSKITNKRKEDSSEKCSLLKNLLTGSTDDEDDDFMTNNTSLPTKDKINYTNKNTDDNTTNNMLQNVAALKVNEKNTEVVESTSENNNLLLKALLKSSNEDELPSSKADIFSSLLSTTSNHTSLEITSSDSKKQNSFLTISLPLPQSQGNNKASSAIKRENSSDLLSSLSNKNNPIEALMSKGSINESKLSILMSGVDGIPSIIMDALSPTLKSPQGPEGKRTLTMKNNCKLLKELLSTQPTPQNIVSPCRLTTLPTHQMTGFKRTTPSPKPSDLKLSPQNTPQSAPISNDKSCNELYEDIFDTNKDNLNDDLKSFLNDDNDLDFENIFKSIVAADADLGDTFEDSLSLMEHAIMASDLSSLEIDLLINNDLNTPIPASSSSQVKSLPKYHTSPGSDSSSSPSPPPKPPSAPLIPSNLNTPRTSLMTVTHKQQNTTFTSPSTPYSTMQTSSLQLPLNPISRPALNRNLSVGACINENSNESEKSLKRFKDLMNDLAPNVVAPPASSPLTLGQLLNSGRNLQHLTSREREKKAECKSPSNNVKSPFSFITSQQFSSITAVPGSLQALHAFKNIQNKNTSLYHANVPYHNNTNINDNNILIPTNSNDIHNIINVNNVNTTINDTNTTTTTNNNNNNNNNTSGNISISPSSNSKVNEGNSNNTDRNTLTNNDNDKKPVDISELNNEDKRDHKADKLTRRPSTRQRINNRNNKINKNDDTKNNKKLLDSNKHSRKNANRNSNIKMNNKDETVAESHGVIKSSSNIPAINSTSNASTPTIKKLSSKISSQNQKKNDEGKLTSQKKSISAKNALKEVLQERCNNNSIKMDALGRSAELNTPLPSPSTAYLRTSSSFSSSSQPLSSPSQPSSSFFIPPSTHFNPETNENLPKSELFKNHQVNEPSSRDPSLLNIEINPVDFDDLATIIAQDEKSLSLNKNWKNYEQNANMQKTNDSQNFAINKQELNQNIISSQKLSDSSIPSVILMGEGASNQNSMVQNKILSNIMGRDQMQNRIEMASNIPQQNLYLIETEGSDNNMLQVQMPEAFFKQRQKQQQQQKQPLQQYIQQQSTKQQLFKQQQLQQVIQLHKNDDMSPTQQKFLYADNTIRQQPQQVSSNQMQTQLIFKQKDLQKSTHQTFFIQKVDNSFPHKQIYQPQYQHNYQMQQNQFQKQNDFYIQQKNASLLNKQKQNIIQQQQSHQQHHQQPINSLKNEDLNNLDDDEIYQLLSTLTYEESSYCLSQLAQQQQQSNDWTDNDTNNNIILNNNNNIIINGINNMNSLNVNNNTVIINNKQYMFKNNKQNNDGDLQMNNNINNNQDIINNNNNTVLNNNHHHAVLHNNKNNNHQTLLNSSFINNQFLNRSQLNNYYNNQPINFPNQLDPSKRHVTLEKLLAD